MRKTRNAWVRFGTLLAAVLLYTAPATLAQDEDPAKSWHEPGIDLLQRGKPWAQWLTGTLFLAGCLLIAFKHPHRTHLD